MLQRELDEYVGSVYSIEECWGLCEDTYGSELVAVNRDQNNCCYCQHDCQCLDEGHGGGYYVATSDAIPELPGPCGGGGGGGDDDSSSLADCAADGDDCPAYWVGDGVCDGVDQWDGCDLSCYDQDGGDCCGGYACTADDDWGTWDDGDDASYGGLCRGLLGRRRRVPRDLDRRRCLRRPGPGVRLRPVLLRARRWGLL